MIGSLEEEDPVFCAHNYSAVHSESPEKIVDLYALIRMEVATLQFSAIFVTTPSFVAGKGLGPLGPGRLLAVSSQPSTFHGFIKTSWRISINIAGMSALKLENLPKLVIR